MPEAVGGMLSWGMTPSVGSATAASMWHFCYNSPDELDVHAGVEGCGCDAISGSL